MEDSLISDPHDRFFKESFGRKDYAVPFFRRVLPPSLCRQIQWETLERQETTFLDETLSRRSSDLLFSVQWDGQETRLYCLFEHQSRCDPGMPLRLLRYMVRIWDRWEQDNPGCRRWPLIIPVVLYQGRGGWTAPADMRGLFKLSPAAGSDWECFVPVFRYTVVDVHEASTHARFKDWQVRHVLSLLASVFLEDAGERLERAFDSIEQLFAGGDDLTFIHTALSYLFATSGDVDKSAFREQIMKLDNPRLKEVSMSIAEQLKAEGHMEGLERGLEQGLERGLEQGLEQGLNRGETLGAIRELQKLLGYPVDSVDALAAKADSELSVQRDLLESEIRKLLGRPG